MCSLAHEREREFFSIVDLAHSVESRFAHGLLGVIHFCACASAKDGAEGQPLLKL